MLAIKERTNSYGGEMKDIIKYEISKDGIGLKAYFKDFYHIPSNELTELERWILGILKKSLNAYDNGWHDAEKEIKKEE